MFPQYMHVMALDNILVRIKQFLPWNYVIGVLCVENTDAVKWKTGSEKFAGT